MSATGLGSLRNITPKILFVAGLLLSATQLILPVFVPMLDLQLRSIHVAFGISLALLVFPFSQKRKGQGFTYFDVAAVVVVIAANINIFIKTLTIYYRPGEATTFDVVIGIALIIIVLEASRRTVGWAIPVFVILLFLYVQFGAVFPGMWKLKGLSLKFVINSVYYSALGIYGSVTGMSATFISMFIIFGALISGAGGGRTFIDIALLLTGKYRGGPAKAAVVASALFGSISGSSVANVSVTGNYTIPLMKSLGYDKNFAGAVEAIASTGGGITPPIMSITAFMMSEFLGLPYLQIIGYAVIPCALYFTGVFSGVHFETIRTGLRAVPEEDIPSIKEVVTFRRLVPLVIPTGILLTLIGMGKPLLYAGFFACASTIAVFFLLNVQAIGMRRCVSEMCQALYEGGIDLARIVPILVAVNILVNMIGITGIAPKISGLIFEIGGENVFLALLVATIVPFILGTSLPVVPTYVISLSILVPPLLKLGVDEVAAHLFFIYWAILGSVTPPTCTASIVAAGIAEGNWLKTGFLAVRLGIVAFIVPYFFVLNPALVGRADILTVFVYAVPALLGAIFLADGMFGPIRRFKWPLRVAFWFGGFCLLFPNHLMSVVGILLASGAAFIQYRDLEVVSVNSPSDINEEVHSI